VVYHLLPAMYSTLAYRVPTKLYSVRQVENGKPLNDKFFRTICGMIGLQDTF